MANIKFSQFTTTSPADTVSLVGYLSTDNVKFTIADLKTQFNNSYVTLDTSQTITATKQFTTFPILGNQAYTASYGSEVKLYSSHNADSRWIFNSVGVHNKIFSFRVNDLQRWAFRVNQDAESGSNAGTNFEIRRYNDAGTFIDSPISITRSNGTVAFGGNIQLLGSMQLGDGVTLSNGELQTLDGVTTGVSIQTQLNSKEPTITAGTNAQYYRGDKTFQTLDKAAVGLGNVDNTSDANKPISILTQAALDNRSVSIASAGSVSITITATGSANLQSLTGHSFTINEALMPVGATITINGLTERPTGGSGVGSIAYDVNGVKRYITTSSGHQYQYQFTLYRENSTTIRMMGGTSGSVMSGAFGSVNIATTTATVTSGGNIVFQLFGYGSVIADVIAYRFFKAILTR